VTEAVYPARHSDIIVGQPTVLGEGPGGGSASVRVEVQISRHFTSGARLAIFRAWE